MDGYRTTGFFIQWLTTKDPDAIRKFHETVRDLDEWSFDKAMKRMFGDDASIEGCGMSIKLFIKINIETRYHEEDNSFIFSFADLWELVRPR